MKTTRRDGIALTFAATVLLGTGGAWGARAATVLSYWDFNNVAPAYATNLEGSFATTANGPGIGNGELYNAATSRLSANSSLSHLAGAYLDLGGTLATGGVNGQQSGSPIAFSGSTASSWGAFSDSGGINLAAGDASTGAGSLFLYPGGSAATSIVFNLSSAGYSGLNVSFADRASINNSVTDSFSYSLDGGATWTAIGNVTAGNGSFSLVSLALPSALDNQGGFLLKMAANFQSPETSNAIDDFQFTAISAVPEPSAMAFLLLAAVTFLLRPRLGLS